MKIKALRRLDIWIGRPLCWAITALYKIKKLFIRKGAIDAPQKILFIKLFGIGSIILAIPSIEAVKRKYPDASVYFLTFEENTALFGITGIIPDENLFTVRKDSLGHLSADVIRVLLSLIRKKIDIVIDLEFFSRFTAILSFAIRSKYRIGFYGFHTEGLRRGSFIDFQVNYNHTIHTSEAFFSLLAPLGITQKEYSPSIPKIPPSPGFRENITARLRSAHKNSIPLSSAVWIVINPNSSDLIELRKWPAEYFIRLTRLLIENNASVGVIFTGSNDERPYVESLCSEFTAAEAAVVINLAGMTGIRDLIDLFHFADLFITNDSGPAHLASLTDIRSIVFFGPETPALYCPLGGRSECLYTGLYCQPCVTIYNGKRSYCRNNICLRDIGPEYVYDLAMKKLSDRESSGQASSQAGS